MLYTSHCDECRVTVVFFFFFILVNNRGNNKEKLLCSWFVFQVSAKFDLVFPCFKRRKEWVEQTRLYLTHTDWTTHLNVFVSNKERGKKKKKPLKVEKEGTRCMCSIGCCLVYSRVGDREQHSAVLWARSLAPPWQSSPVLDWEGTWVPVPGDHPPEK